MCHWTARIFLIIVQKQTLVEERVLIKKFHIKDVEQNVAYCSHRPTFPSGQNGYCGSLSKNRDEDKLLSFAKAHDNNDEWNIFHFSAVPSEVIA